VPTNLYGPEDNFDLAASHVLPALIRKFHEAKIGSLAQVTLWGTGTPLREFMHVDDLAAAAVFLLENYNSGDIVNVGTGEDLPIRDLAQMVSQIVGYRGGISFDVSKPDGTPRKLLSVERLHALGWRHQIPLEQGIKDTYDWYVTNSNELATTVNPGL
jgi:GDP-L-fucose synthase